MDERVDRACRLVDSICMDKDLLASLFEEHANNRSILEKEQRRQSRGESKRECLIGTSTLYSHSLELSKLKSQHKALMSTETTVPEMTLGEINNEIDRETSAINVMMGKLNYRTQERVKLTSGLGEAVSFANNSLVQLEDLMDTVLSIKTTGSSFMTCLSFSSFSIKIFRRFSSKAMPFFSLESTTPFPLPSYPTQMSVFKHNASELRCVFLPLPGPLVSLNILLPTPSIDHKGLPHTLEHLIFSSRGYLDYLATRNLSQGTNAYTAEDHTSYQITTAGHQSMINLLPTFLDHVLHPTLKESVFTTEVYHLDGDAKHQGVVYCEMKSRENTDSDLKDLAMRRLLFQNATTYSYESGGLTRDIKHLRNNECKDFHKQWYHLDNTTIIIMGQINPESVFEALEAAPGLLIPTKVDKSLQPPTYITAPPLPNIPTRVIPQTIHFPSADEEIGSFAIGWRFNTADFKRSIAVEVLLRFLHDTSSSPFYQAFVEIKNPIASDVDSEIKSFVSGAVVLHFNGIPYRKDGGNEEDDDEEMSEEGGSDDSMSESEDGHDEHPDGYYFEAGRMHGLVLDVLKNTANNALTNPETLEKIQSTITRHTRKINEGLEDDPHEFIAMMIPPDIVSYHLGIFPLIILGPPEYGPHTKSSNGKPNYGACASIFSTLEELRHEPLSYWKDLIEQTMIEPVACTILCVPSRSLSDTISSQELAEIADRTDVYGQQGLSKLGERALTAVKENEVKLPQTVLDSMPPVPDASSAPMLKSRAHVGPIPGDNDQISQILQISTETAFAHLRVCLNTSVIPKELRPFLVLFQECLFQTDVISDDGSVEDWKSVVDRTAALCISHEAGLGLGNEIFSTSWLDSVFIIGGTSEWDSFEDMVSHIMHVLSSSVFTEERVTSICKNLTSDIIENKRGGREMLRAICTRVTTAQGENEREISVFRQDAFLAKVLADVEWGLKGLRDIQDCLMGQAPESIGGFVQIGCPIDSKNDVITDIVARTWKQECGKWKARGGAIVAGKKAVQSPFPFPRPTFSPDHIDSKYGNSIIVGIPGLQSSYLSQFVSCDVLGSANKTDQLAVNVLCELLSRMEGPLFAGVRGKGLAYGCYVGPSLWTGQLELSIYRSSEPRKALIVFYDILEYLNTPKGFGDLCSNFHIDTARSMVSYNRCASKSTSGGIIANSLRSNLRGMTAEQEIEQEKMLAKIGKDDMKRVFDKYFVKFFDHKQRMTIVVSAPGEGEELLQQSFEQVPLSEDRPYCGTGASVDLSRYLFKIKQFKLEEFKEE